MSNAWIVIPARGGSVGIPRKNLWLLNGKPMVWHAINSAIATKSRVVLITDDDEISEVGESLGVDVIIEPEQATGKKTLDEVILSFLPEIKALGAKSIDKLITLQPTSPLITPTSLTKAIQILQSGSVLSVSDDRHLRWKKSDQGYAPDYEKRVNRQLLPESWRETGAIIGCLIEDLENNQTRINQPVSLIELNDDEAIDIDSFSDLAIAEHFFSRKTIFFKTDSSEQLGMGHVYRVLALAQELARHNLKIFISPDKPLGEKFFSQYGFEFTIANDQEFLEEVSKASPDLVIFDQLDTDKGFLAKLKQLSAETKIITFEDQGSGAELADLVVSDLYPSKNINQQKQLIGIENAVLAPSFETLDRQRKTPEKVSEIVVLFGGTDPSELALKALSALQHIDFEGKVKVIRGLGATEITQEFNLDIEFLSNVKNMPRVLSRADIALSSAGRTITELASLGVPTICMAQNEKELNHSHTTKQNGVLMLGLGSDVTIEELAKQIKTLLDDHQLRKTLSVSALEATKNRSNKRIVAEMLSRVFS
jgi:spore coat polysaccharide biosynthesis predicted glycosyltransferase SpsG/CMP-N-acetylneuraminic acid synthetase